MRKITMGLTGFAGALLLIASMGSAMAHDHRGGAKFQHDRGYSKGAAYHAGDHDRQTRKKHKRRHAEYRDRDDRHGKKHHRKHKKRHHAHDGHHDKHARHHHKRHHKKHARRHHKRHHDKHARRHHKRHHKHHGHHGGHHRTGIDLGGLTFFFGQSQKHYSQGYSNVSQVCQDVSKVGWWYGQKALIGGTGCYDQYGNFYVHEGSRYLIRYIY